MPAQTLRLKGKLVFFCLLSADNSSLMFCFHKNRASSSLKACCERDFLCWRSGHTLLPGGGLHAPQPDLASGGSDHQGPHWEGEASGRLNPADQRGSNSGCWSVSLCGYQLSRRQQNHRVAPCPRYGRTIRRWSSV